MTTTAPAPLTARQREVLAWIAATTRERGFPPTLREGQAAFRFKAPNGFLCHVQALERKGYLSRSRSPR